MYYEKIYNQIIERAKVRVLKGYKEKHHIIPKCMGGVNDKENLVDLTAKEHFICHKLLCKIYPNSDKLKFALWAMCNLKNAAHQRNYIISASEYSYIREMVSISKTGKNSRLSKYIPSAETRKKLSDANKGQVPWNKGLEGYRKGSLKTDDHKDKISKALKGRIISEDTKKKMSESRTGMIRVKKECIYCNRFLDPGNYSKFHGDRCKFNLVK
jgi:hypothetical protein